MKQAKNIKIMEEDAGPDLEGAAMIFILLHIEERLERLIDKIAETVTDDQLDQGEKLKATATLTVAAVNGLKRYIKGRLRVYCRGPRIQAAKN